MAQRGPCFSSCCKAAQGQGVAGAGAARCGWPGTGKSCRPVPLLPSPHLPSSRLLPGPLLVADRCQTSPRADSCGQLAGGPGPEAPGGLLLAWGAQPSERLLLPGAQLAPLLPCSKPPRVLQPAPAGQALHRWRDKVKGESPTGSLRS